MKGKVAITIGIPAYNEEANIKQLLDNLLAQKQDRVRIDSIVVVTDGCTDDTVNQVRAVHDARVRMVETHERKGLQECQNIILHEASSDILVIMNADVLPTKDTFLDELALPIMSNRADLVSADLIPVSPSGFVEGAIYQSHLLRREIYSLNKQGHNLYLCNGGARAFSKRLYSSLEWPVAYGEDSYSYLFCLSKGLNFVHSKDAAVLLKMPTTISDHLKQSLRHVDSKRNMNDFFPSKMNKDEYMVPLRHIPVPLMRHCIQHPLRIGFYTLILLYSRLLSLLPSKTNSFDRYEQSVSTKRLMP